MVRTRAESVLPTDVTAPTAVPRRRFRALGAIGLVAVVLAAVLLLRLGAQQRGGPAQTPISLPNGAPATLYIPGHLDVNEFPLPPVGLRPPLVVVAHGYSADEAIMSTIARSLARAGYAALTFDFRGHGANTAAFKGDLGDDLDAALDWADRSPYVDPNRIALLGQSMGAGAVLEFASHDPRPKAVIPLSGGWEIDDIRVPPNVLFLAAAGDPKRIRDNQATLERRLAGRTNVRRVVIPGKDHVTEMWAGRTLTESVRWLDAAFGIQRRGPVPGVVDPRLGTAGLYFLVAVVLLGFVGLLAGRLVPPLPSSAGPGGWILLALALLLTLPLLAVGAPSVVPLSEGSVVTSLALAGGMLWAVRWYSRRGAVSGPVAAWMGTGPWFPVKSVLLPGVAAGVAIFVLLAPLGWVFHRLVPTPERLVLWIAVAALVLPFFVAFEAIVRRGGPWSAVGWGLLGRLLLLAALALGVATHALSPIVGLVLPLLVGLFLLLEVFAGAAYASGRNPALIGVVDAVFVAWIVTATIPVI